MAGWMHLGWLKPKSFADRGSEEMFSRTFFFVLILAAISCTAGMADTGVPWVGWVTPANLEEASLFVLPDGSGPPLTEARYFGGDSADASIEVGLIDVYGNPIASFPWEDIWLDPETDNAYPCNAHGYGGFAADSNTDANGVTTFATSLAGGGWTEGPIWVYLNGSRAMYPDWIVHPPVPSRFNSADINGDGLVNLTDVALFAGDYFGSYHYRSDFWWDGVLNLADIAKMAPAYGLSCE